MANFTPLSAAIGGALIGLSAALLMLSTGRIAGISGIVVFVAAMIAGMALHAAWQRQRVAAATQALGVGADG